jgi:diguanylate cyclase (GGDEF)-like protein
MMDLDHFKEVNDSFGHDRGDQVLRTLSRQFLALQERGSLVARLGGDEFVYVLEHIEDQAEAQAFALRIGQEVQCTVSIDGQNVTVSVSVGMAMFPTDGRDIESILKKADIALYQAKRLVEK